MEPERFKKPRCVFTKGAARAVLMCKGPPDVEWLEREVEQLCRTHSWPLNHLLHKDFLTRLGNLLDTRTALTVLEDIRSRYTASHPFTEKKDDDLEAAARDCEFGDDLGLKE